MAAAHRSYGVRDAKPSSRGDNVDEEGERTCVRRHRSSCSHERDVLGIFKSVGSARPDLVLRGCSGVRRLQHAAQRRRAVLRRHPGLGADCRDQGGTIELRPGNVAMILSGEPHAVRTSSDSEAHANWISSATNTAWMYRRRSRSGNGGAIAARVFCAKLKVSWPTGLRRVSMPPVVTSVLTVANYSSLSAVRAETLQFPPRAAGSSALLTRLAAFMLTASLRDHPQCLLLFRSSEWSDPIAHALHLIGSDPSADWSVARLAREVGMGRSSFAARFTRKSVARRWR